MRLGVLSDTHIPGRSLRLPEAVFTRLQGVDAILHAGDIEHPRVLDELEAVAPVIAVRGNMDSALYQLPVSRTLRVEGREVGLIHGYGAPRHLIRDWTRKQFNRPAVIVYGHTHVPFWGQEDGVWFMNPGSPTAGAEYMSMGLLEISKDLLHGEIIRL